MSDKLLGPGEVFILSPPQPMGEMQPAAMLEVEPSKSKDIGWTFEERRGWEVKELPEDFVQQISGCVDDKEKLSLIDRLPNMTESTIGKKVLAMGIMGWVRGVVREKSELVSFWHVDAGGSIFPLELADDDRCCFVTTSQINKKCFEVIRGR